MKAFMSLLIASIRIYQKTLSPDHGIFKAVFPYGVCRYEPTCSEYTVQALRSHGWYGIPMAVRRITRCHPFAQGGYDPVPSIEKKL